MKTRVVLLIVGITLGAISGYIGGQYFLDPEIRALATENMELNTTHSWLLYETESLHQAIIDLNSTVEESPTLLFVQYASQGYFRHLQDDRYLLTFHVSPHTGVFTDRPYRMVDMINTSQFVGIWDLGEDSFRDDPPNAAIVLSDSADHEDVLVVELLDPVYVEKGILHYEVILLAEEEEGVLHRFDSDLTLPEEFSHASIFIDGASIGVNWGRWTTIEPPSG